MVDQDTFNHYTGEVAYVMRRAGNDTWEAYNGIVELYNDRPTFTELLFIAIEKAKNWEVRRDLRHILTEEIQRQITTQGEEYIRSRAKELGMVDAPKVEAPPMLPPTDRHEGDDTGQRALKERIPEMLEALEVYTGVVPPIDSSDGRKAIASLFSSLTGGKVETIARYLKSVYNQSTD